MIEATLRSIAERYPGPLVQRQIRDIPRIAYHVGLVQTIVGHDVSICDVGGGVGLFSVGCAALGMRVTLVDDFNDEVYHRYGDSILDLHRSYGVQIVRQSVVEQELALPAGSLDVVTSFDSMEHWHHSPKRLFAGVVRALRSGGLFVLGGPNCVDFFKRLATPLGRARWSKMEDWYDREVFRGHVREPNVSDLRYIARDMGLVNARVFGRSWAGYRRPPGSIRTAWSVLDRLLRLRPSLCTTIYLVGTRP